MSKGCKIITDFVRPPWELVEEFRVMPAANIDDCMGRTAAMNYRAAGVTPNSPYKNGPGEII